MQDLTQRLIYLDKEFISTMYESTNNYTAETRITKTEGIQTGARIPLFSAGVSSVESKAYSISTTGMLKRLQGGLEDFPVFPPSGLTIGSSSTTCWVNGVLTISKVKVRHHKHTMALGKSSEQTGSEPERIVAEESYFRIESESTNFALITTNDYFSSGLSTFLDLSGTVVKTIEIPVRALIRVFSAQTLASEQFAVPNIIFEE